MVGGAPNLGKVGMASAARGLAMLHFLIVARPMLERMP